MAGAAGPGGRRRSVKATTSELSTFELDILQAFDYVIDRPQWKFNRVGFVDVNQLAQVVAHGELRKEAWARHVAAERGLDLERLGAERVLEIWHRGIPWGEYERIRDGFDWDEDLNWSLEPKIRGRLVAMRRRGLVWRDAERYGWTLTEEGDEALFAAGCEGLA